MSPSVVTRLEQLAVEQSNTFFYDHPLDHVPGMVLFDALLRAAQDAHAENAENASAVEPSRIRASLDFTKICESDTPTTLSCTPADDRGGWSVSAVQGEREVCSGTFAFEFAFEFGEQPPRPHTHPSAHERLPAADHVPTSQAKLGRPPVHDPAPAQLVHRSRPENILVGELRRPPIESLLLTPPDGHVLLRRDPHIRSAVELVEAGRQFIVMLAHTEGGAAMDTQMLWLSVTIDIPARLPRDTPALLRCVEHSGSAQRMICTVLLADATSGAELGMLNYVTRNIAPSSYARMRAR